MLHEIPESLIKRTSALMAKIVKQDCHISDQEFTEQVIPLHEQWQRESMKADAARKQFEALAPEFTGPDFQPTNIIEKGA